MSKVVAGAAVLMLVEEGKVPPDYYTVPAEREITVLDLLTHISGLMSGRISSSVAQQGFQGRHETGLAYVDGLGAVPLEFQPGSRWAYSAVGGFGMMLANGGEHDGVRLLGTRTVELMGSAYIPDTLPGRRPGEGFGLSVRVVTDPSTSRYTSRPSATAYTRPPISLTPPTRRYRRDGLAISNPCSSTKSPVTPCLRR